ncbi:MAG: hypothetical protein KFB93_06500 [Simkaniaceae bacterium]|nr:MAG: hypothetical protein KFB93_06500 [Simkaniaceae bacterium]
MKKILLFLFPFSLWAQTLFVLFDAGETVALSPVANELKERGEEVTILKFDPKTRDRYQPLLQEDIEGYAPDVLVVGDASYLQLQFVKAYKGNAKTVCYYDNPLEIERIPYVDLIREFEKEVDLFLVPSGLAASSSHAPKCLIVGNPDLDFFENEIQSISVSPGRITYFGGYDCDYEEAFKAFVAVYKDYQGEVIVRPHPKTDGDLEKKWTQGTSIIVGESLSTIEAIGCSERIIIHRSSIGTKAAIAGKKVFSIESDGTIEEVRHSRQSLNLPSKATLRIADLLL